MVEELLHYFCCFECNSLFAIDQKSFGNPNPYSSRRKYSSTPPICTAVRPPFVSLDLPGFEALKKGKPNSTPPICTAVRLPFVLQYASHLYGSTFEKVLGVGVTGNFLNRLCQGMFQTCFECGHRGQVLQSHPLPISPLLQTPEHLPEREANPQADQLVWRRRERTQHHLLITFEL